MISYMSIFDKISLGIQLLTFAAATYIGVIQTQINTRQAMLQDFVAIAASPDASGEKITLLNTGKTNLYIQRIEIGDEVYRYDRPRLLATGTMDSSYYWVSPPESLPIDKDFELKVYVADEFGTMWVSEHGGRVYESTGEQSIKKRTLSLWSYKMEKVQE